MRPSGVFFCSVAGPCASGRAPARRRCSPAAARASGRHLLPRIASKIVDSAVSENRHRDPLQYAMRCGGHAEGTRHRTFEARRPAMPRASIFMPPTREVGDRRREVALREGERVLHREADALLGQQGDQVLAEVVAVLGRDLDPRASCGRRASPRSKFPTRNLPAIIACVTTAGAPNRRGSTSAPRRTHDIFAVRVLQQAHRRPVGRMDDDPGDRLLGERVLQHRRADDVELGRAGDDRASPPRRPSPACRCRSGRSRCCRRGAAAAPRRSARP